MNNILDRKRNACWMDQSLFKYYRKCSTKGQDKKSRFSGPSCRAATLVARWQGDRINREKFGSFYQFEAFKIAQYNKRSRTKRSNQRSTNLWLMDWLGPRLYCRFLKELAAQRSAETVNRGLAQYVQYQAHLPALQGNPWETKWLGSPNKGKFKGWKEYRRHIELRSQSEEIQWRKQWKLSPNASQFPTWQDFKLANETKSNQHIALIGNTDANGGSVIVAKGQREASNANPEQTLPVISSHVLGLKQCSCERQISKSLLSMRATLESGSKSAEWEKWLKFRVKLRELVSRKKCGNIFDAKTKTIGICCIFQVINQESKKRKFPEMYSYVFIPMYPIICTKLMILKINLSSELGIQIQTFSSFHEL